MQLSNDLPEGWSHVHLAETDSLMLALKREETATEETDIVLATTDFQTAGRGQRGTSWEAERGANLLFGLRCHPRFLTADRQFLLSEIQALAVALALDAHGEGFSVKWPNDLYWHDRKIGGMLLEHDLCGTVIDQTISGVGLNVNQTVFKGNAPNPVSLGQITGRHHDLAGLLTAICRHFDHLYRRLQHHDEAAIHSLYLSRLYHRQGFHPYADAQGRFEAEIIGVAPIGTLILRDRQGALRHYAFKEVRQLL